MADLVESLLIVFGPFLPYFFGGILVGGLLGAVLQFGLEATRFPGR